MSSIRLRGNTGKWFLPLFAGTQRVNVEYDPGELAGAHLAPVDILKTYDFTTGVLPAGTFDKFIGTGGMTHYIQNAEGRYVARGADVPAFVRNTSNYSQILGLELFGIRGTYGLGFGNFTSSNYTKTNLTASTETPTTFSSLFDGNTTVTKLTGASGTVERRVRFTNSLVSFVDSTRYTLSFRYRKDTASSGTNEFWVGVVSVVAPTTDYSGVLIDIDAETATPLNGGYGTILESRVTNLNVDGWYEVVLYGTMSAGVDQASQLTLTSGGAFTHAVAGQTLYTAGMSYMEDNNVNSDSYGLILSSTSNGGINPTEWISSDVNFASGQPYGFVIDMDFYSSADRVSSSLPHIWLGSDSTGLVNAMGLYGASTLGQMRLVLITAGVTRLSVNFSVERGRNRFVFRSSASGYSIHRNGVLVGSAAFVEHFTEVLDYIEATATNDAGARLLRKLTVTGDLSESQAQQLSVLP